MQIFYYTKRGNESTDLNDSELNISAAVFSFYSTTKPGFDYKVSVVGASQEQIDKITNSDVDLITTQEDFNSH